MNLKHLKPTHFLTFCLVSSLGFYSQSQAQAPVQMIPDTASFKYNEISTRAKLYVYPSKKQSQQQQKNDEFECYQWAVQSSGIDPLNLPKVEAAPVQTGPDGSAVKGAAKGALVGVAVGAIAGDAGKGAAIGATVGGAAGVRNKRVNQAAQANHAQESAKAQQADIEANFKKAFSVCLEGKGYSIK